VVWRIERPWWPCPAGSDGVLFYTVGFVSFAAEACDSWDEEMRDTALVAEAEIDVDLALETAIKAAKCAPARPYLEVPALSHCMVRDEC